MAGKTNTNTNTKTSTSARSQANEAADDTFAGLPVDDKFFTFYIPQAFHGIDRTPNGIQNLLTVGGIDGKTIADLKADTENGATRINAILQDPKFQERVAKRINLKPADTQVSEDKGGKNGEKPKPKTPVLPKPQSPAAQTEGVKSFMGISGAASKIGGQRGGPLKMVREEITPDGGRVTVTEFYEPGPGNTLSPVGREVADSAGNVVASEGVTDTTAPKQDEKPAKAPRKTFAEWAKAENRPTFWERLDANMAGFEKRGGSPTLPNQAAIGAMTGVQHAASGAGAMAYRNWPAVLGATALGAGAKYMMSGTSAPSSGAPPQAVDYQGLFGIPTAAPAQERQPDQQATQQGNPAGSPADTDTTLMQLQRLLKSREYA